MRKPAALPAAGFFLTAHNVPAESKGACERPIDINVA
jgi:hypothetical protein